MTRTLLVWAALGAAMVVPLVAAAASPLLAWRHPVYIAAGFAGVIALALLLAQPLLIGGDLPGLSPARARRLHRWIGGLLVAAVIVHVGALWITSPPDVLDALLFASPTPFSLWGVLAMWAVFATSLVALVRPRLRLRTWRTAHTCLAVLIAGCTILHAMLIEGTMETVSKAILCALVLMATLRVVFTLRIWQGKSRHTR